MIKHNPALVEGLQARVSHPKLDAPAPTAEELEHCYQAAFRAPDHAWLRPWRFIECRGEERETLGQIFSAGIKADGTDLPEYKMKKIEAGPLRAPLVLVCYAELIEHAKVPFLEQQVATGCAANNLISALFGLGYGAVWRTGAPAFSAGVRQRLGLTGQQQIIGMLYIGTPKGAIKTAPQLNSSDYVKTLSQQLKID